MSTSSPTGVSDLRLLNSAVANPHLLVYLVAMTMTVIVMLNTRR